MNAKQNKKYFYKCKMNGGLLVELLTKEFYNVGVVN